MPRHKNVQLHRVPSEVYIQSIFMPDIRHKQRKKYIEFHIWEKE